MLKSLQMKLVVILVLLIASAMAIVGTVLINSINNFYFNDFNRQIGSVLSPDLITSVEGSLENPSGADIFRIVNAHSGPLGISSYRNIYILDEMGEYIAGSNPELGKSLEKTSNMVSAMAGRIGNDAVTAKSYMDYAVPVQTKNGFVIIYIKDTMESVHSLTKMLFAIILRSLLVALLIAVALSYLLAKTISGPIKRITKGALQIAASDFSQTLPVSSDDEIGTLTQTFNTMANELEMTLEEVNKERSKLETIFLYLEDGVMAFNQVDELLHINKSALDLLGYTEQETQNLSVDSLARQFDLPVSFREVTGLQEQSFLTFDVSCLGRRLKLYFAPFSMEQSTASVLAGGVIVVIHDDTESHRLEESRREFVANVSHELRTPLTAVKSYAETILENREISQETREQFLQVIVNETDRMTALVKDLLLLSRLDNKKMAWKFQEFDLRSVLQQVAQSLQIEAENRNHKLILSTSDDLCSIVGDPQRIKQVGVNLLSNAIKYTPEGGTIRLSAVRDGQQVRLAVEDNGLGIPAEDADRIFERFYRVDRGRSREAGGTGLGLAIAKEIVLAHSGTIDLESEEGLGTKITIALPVNPNIHSATEEG